MTRIEKMFVILQAAGLRAPKVYETAYGMKAGLAVYDLKLAELTDDELDAAVDTYLDVGRFWPQPAELLEQVPHLTESRESWLRVTGIDPASLLEIEVVSLVGLDDPAAYRQAYRQAKARFLATPREDRVVRGEIEGRRSRRALVLNPDIVADLPKLLTVGEA